MGHKAKRVKHLDSFFNIVLRVKGREKNEMIRYADKLDMSLSQSTPRCLELMLKMLMKDPLQDYLKYI